MSILFGIFFVVSGVGAVLGGYMMFKAADQLREEHDRLKSEHRILALGSAPPARSDSGVRWLQLGLIWLGGIGGIALGVSLIVF